MATLLERERELEAVHRLVGEGGVLLIEGGAGIGKTSVLDAACGLGGEAGRAVLRARGSELESEFAFGVVGQLFERALVTAAPGVRDELLAGPAAAVRTLLLGDVVEAPASDTSFAVLHGLYWLTANLADRRPLLIAIDDAQWADEPSLRLVAYLASRLEGLPVALLVALRPVAPALAGASLPALEAAASATVRPALLSEAAVAAIARASLGEGATEAMCAAVWEATGGNPLYVTALLSDVELENRSPAELDPAALLARGQQGVARRVVARIHGLGPQALGLAQALAVLGDGAELRHAAAIARLDMPGALSLATGLVRIEVLATEDPPRFLHPVVRDAVQASLPADGRDAAHRLAAHLLHADGAPPGQVAAHLTGVRPAADGWVLARLRDAAGVAMQGGAPRAAAALLNRALAEPPPPARRMEVLRETARAEAAAGSEMACTHLEEAMSSTGDPRKRAEIALEVAETYAGLFRWVDAVDVIERALAELGDADAALAGRLEGELVVCGLHDARRASHVPGVLRRVSSRPLAGAAAEAVAVATGLAMVLAGRRAAEAGVLLEDALTKASPRAENWDTRAALLWTLVVAERFRSVEGALGPMLAEVHRTGGARGFVAVYSTLGLLHTRLGGLPEADAAARVALRVLQEGDFAPGLAFAATVLADVAVEAGELQEAQRLIELLPQEGWPAGVGTVLIPAARGRLRLAQGRPAEALADFRRCAEMFNPQIWGTEVRDIGYVHARAGAALALLGLGEREAAREVAHAELGDARAFGAPRALGIACRVAGLADGGEDGLGLLAESVTSLRASPAVLELAHSLTEFGAALRRGGQRAAARDPLAEALELAVRCGGRRLAARAREELRATGARPRREWRTGVEALTPTELRIVRLAAGGRTNREIAYELYVTLKTVEGHLSRAYTKLRIEGRAQLSGVLEGEKPRVPTL